MPCHARSRSALALTLLGALAAGHAAAASSFLPGYLYVSPVPGATMILPATNVIVRPGGRLDPASLDPLNTLVVEGSRTGAHAGRLRLSDDGETLVFRIQSPFVLGETVTCRIAAGIRTESGARFPEASFAFHVVGSRPSPAGDATLSLFGEPAEEGAARADPPDTRADAPTAPGDPPPLQVVTSEATAPGDVFVSDLRFDDVSYPSHLLQVRNDGSLAFQRRLAGRGFDFKRQGDRLTYFDASAAAFYALNPLHAVVDSFRCGNGYETDPHELALLPNGHALLMAYDPELVDMSQIVPGGRADARVTGLIVQELDLEKEVVFQWRSWDHFAITDATHLKFTAPALDYCHGNAIEPDRDGDLLLSSRHMEEITKISRATGEIVWRLGGRNNQFTFVNDPLRFSHQHAVRRLPNGNLILFDNGNYHSPPFSRAVEYALDEERMTAALVWEYRKSPDAFGNAMGCAQRLPNGNTLIGWGSTNPSVTEVTPDGHVVYQLDLPWKVYSYRAFRFEWPPVRPARVAIHPATVNARSGGSWVMAAIRAEGFDAATIDPATITLAGVSASAVQDSALGDADADDPPDAMVRFSREAVVARLEPGMNRVEVTGSLTTGERFRGAAELRLVGPRSPRGSAAFRSVSSPGEWPLRVAAATGAGVLDLAAFDVGGRLVRRWKAAAGAGGVVEWDGRSDSGARLPSGIYFIRSERGARGGAARVLLLR